MISRGGPVTASVIRSRGNANCQSIVFIRFVTEKPDQDTGLRDGVFAAAFQLLRERRRVSAG